MNIDTSKIVDIELDGLDHHDWPDLCDAYISNAVYPAVANPRHGVASDWRDLTEEELEWLQENRRDWYYEQIYDLAPDILFGGY